MAIAIDTTTVYQPIDGFGVNVGYGTKTANANQYAMPPMTDAEADWFFGTLGFSIARYGAMDTDGTPITPSNALKASSRGARLFVLPMIAGGKMGPDAWYPGGTIDPTYFPAAASMVVGFVQQLIAMGANVSLLEACNEPDGSWSAWGQTPSLVRDFVKTLGPAMASAGLGSIGLIAPSTSIVSNLSTFGNPILGDATASGYTSVVSTHDYGATYGIPMSSPYGLAASAGKPVWVSESDELGYDTFDPSIADGVSAAKRCHLNLVQGNASAYCWHLYRPDGLLGTGEVSGGGNIGLWGLNGEHTKREYTLAQYAKFVRPGCQRVGCTGAPAGIYASAYTRGSMVVVVAINTLVMDQAVTISGLGSRTVLVPWITDSTRNMAEQGTVLFSGGSVSYTLPQQSVTTFIASGSYPLFASPALLSLGTGTATVQFTSATLQAIPAALQLYTGTATLSQATQMQAIAAALALNTGTARLAYTSLSPFKAANGTPLPVKAWNGTQWVDVPFRLWNGTTFN